MNTKLTDFLNETFPNLYRGPMKKGMWFEHDDGWFSIIYDLSYKLEKEIVKMPQEDRDLGFGSASQVKEKFGTLRFYMSSETDEMSKFIQEAENKSGITCEKCGDKGHLRSDGWMKTLCDKCNEERK